MPVLERTDLMANFNTATIDRRLTRKSIEEHIPTMSGTDPMLFGEYRILTTGGTSGVTTYIPFDRRGWVNTVAFYPMYSAMVGLGPRLFPRRKLALLTASGPLHMTFRAPETNRSPIIDTLRLDVTAPLAELGQALESFDPDLLVGYPSVLAALARATSEGQFRISPRLVASGSEQLRPGMHEAITRAWGQPMNVYATTETGGPLAFECFEHSGLHIREDWNIVEVVDADDRAAPEGTVGRSVLVTSWVNPTLPIIRYRLDDQVAVTSERCGCGRPTQRIIDLTGRVEDTVRLPSTSGAHVDVHPNHFEESIEGHPGVGQYQVLHTSGAITVSVVATAGAPTGWEEGLRNVLEDRLSRLGAVPPAIRVEVVGDLPRPATAASKLQIVRSEVAPVG